MLQTFTVKGIWASNDSVIFIHNPLAKALTLNKWKTSNRTTNTYPCERGRWSALRTCSEESHRFGLQSEHSCSSSSCLWLVTRSKWDFCCCLFLSYSLTSFPLRLTVFGCPRNFVSCPRSFSLFRSLDRFFFRACAALFFPL